MEINQFFFTRGNNRKGTLVIVPSNQTVEHCKEELSKPRSVADALLECIVESTNSTAENAALCLLSVLFSKFEEPLISVCIEKGLIDENVDKKMDIIATEAMLQESNINNTKARILFCHLRQFFGGWSYFESEQKRHIFFGDNDFPPTVDKKVLEEQTIIPGFQTVVSVLSPGPRAGPDRTDRPNLKFFSVRFGPVRKNLPTPERPGKQICSAFRTQLPQSSALPPASLITTTQQLINQIINQELMLSVIIIRKLKLRHLNLESLIRPFDC
jgi:hypothetical protein